MTTAAADVISILHRQAEVRGSLPSRLASGHVSPRPAGHAVQDESAADVELLARVRAGLLRL